MCCTRLAANTGRKKVIKNRHLGTIPQLCRATSSQLRHVSTIRKQFVKQQYVHMSLQYGQLQPTSSWDRSGSLGHSCKFQRVLRLGSVTAWHSSSGRQPNFVALDRGRHLHSAGRPSRWALAHIASCCCSSNFVTVNLAVWVIASVVCTGGFLFLKKHCIDNSEMCFKITCESG